MRLKNSRSAGRGLERPCSDRDRDEQSDMLRVVAAAEGIELVEARFRGYPYSRHRHDTYTICQTISGVQGFNYRGAHEHSLRGQIVVLHPDEEHDGHAGNDDGFAYRGAYVAPALIAEAMEALTGRVGPLPFANEAVSNRPRLMHALNYAFLAEAAPLAIDSLLLCFAAGVLELDRSRIGSPRPAGLHPAAVARARELLDAEFARSIHSSELEAVSGLSRFTLARQFRAHVGTSPHRYQIMRRLAFARQRLRQGDRPADAAAEAGFADQAHFSRWFKAAYGLTPMGFLRLERAGRVLGSEGGLTDAPQPVG